MAGAQLGVLSREQALATGLSASGITRRIATGKWIPILEAVYRLAGHRPCPEQLLMAACLWAKDGVAVSHRPAAVRWGLIEMHEPVVEITTETRRRPPRGSGVIVHHARLPVYDVGRLGPFPVTTVTRTLIDLAAVVGEDQLERALDHALRAGRTSLARLSRRLDELGGRGRKGTGALRGLIEQRDAAAATAESALESMMLRLLRRHGVRAPKTQHVITDGAGELRRSSRLRLSGRAPCDRGRWVRMALGQGGVAEGPRPLQRARSASVASAALQLRRHRPERRDRRRAPCAVLSARR